MASMFSQRVTNLIKEPVKKAFVEGRIIVEKVTEEKQMFVEQSNFLYTCLDMFALAKVFSTSYTRKK